MPSRSTMANPMVENAVCPTCGADIREGALFCYGCGKAVPDPAADKAATRTLQFGGDAANGATEFSPAPPSEIVSEASTSVSAGSPTENGKALRTASSLRKRPKTLERKNVEVTWVEPDRPSALFFVVSVVLCLAALTLIALALYLR